MRNRVSSFLALSLCVQLVTASLADVASPPLRIPPSPASAAWMSDQALLLPVINTIRPLAAQFKIAECAHVLLMIGTALAHGIVGSVMIPESFDPTRVVTTTGLQAEDEHFVLGHFLRQLIHEQKKPGSGHCVNVVVISDQHGAIEKFDALLLDAVRQALPNNKIPADFTLNSDQQLLDQLAPFGIRLPEDLQGKIFIHNLGDLMDRGEYGVKVYQRSKELIDLGLSDFIIGNHCFWAALNLQGFHLPSYEGYNLYHYKDGYESRFGDVQELLKTHHKTDPQTLSRFWWAERLAEFTAFQRNEQKTRWKPLDERVNKRGGLHETVALYLTPDSAAYALWEKFSGFNSEHTVSVGTGTHAVGEMSLTWWRQLLNDFKAAHEAELDRNAFQKGAPADLAWSAAIEMMEDTIIPVLAEQLERHVGEKGEWWWRIFEALNAQNYSSPEWWAKDWLFHNNWGTSVLAERNKKLGGEFLTPANYLNDPILQEMANFFRDHFVLHLRDIYQFDYLHAFLPVDDKTGEFFFTYKGQEYRGNGTINTPSFRVGLARISQDVRNRANSMSQLYEAFSLINEWYADNTSRAKESHVVGYINRHGPDELAAANGLHWLPTGHLPLHGFKKKLKDRLGVLTGAFVKHFIFTDHGMGEHFGGRGAYISISPQGYRMRGYRSPESNVIEWDAPTAEKSGTMETILFENPGIPRQEALPELIHNVKTRLDELEGRSRYPRNHFFLRLPENAPPHQQLLDTVHAYGRINDFYSAPMAGDAGRPRLEEAIVAGARHLRFRVEAVPSEIADQGLAVISGNIVLGHADFSLHTTCIWMEWLNVADPVRNMDIAETLLLALIDQAHAKGLKTIAFKSNNEFPNIAHVYHRLGEHLGVYVSHVEHMTIDDEDSDEETTWYKFTLHLNRPYPRQASLKYRHLLGKSL